MINPFKPNELSFSFSFCLYSLETKLKKNESVIIILFVCTMLYDMATLFFHLNSTQFNRPTIITQLCMFAFVPLWVSMKLFRRLLGKISFWNASVAVRVNGVCDWFRWIKKPILPLHFHIPPLEGATHTFWALLFEKKQCEIWVSVYLYGNPLGCIPIQRIPSIY